MSSIARSQSLVKSFSTGNLSYLSRAEDVTFKEPFSKRWYVKGAIVISVLSLSWSASTTRQLYDTESSKAFWNRCTKRS